MKGQSLSAHLAKLIRAAARVRDSLKEHGAAPTAAKLITAAFHRWVEPLFFRVEGFVDQRFDKRMNVDTCRSVHLSQLTIDSDNTDFGDDELIYFAIPVLALRAMKSALPADVSEFVFIDFGCGKGRALLFASELNFKKIMGVEFARELYEQAIGNIRSGGHPSQRCIDIEVLHIDAVEFAIPEDKCVFFLFNPFEEHVLSQVVANIRHSYLNNPREMYVIYHNPKYDHLFDELEMFERIRRRRRSLPSECYDVTCYRAGGGARQGITPSPAAKNSEGENGFGYRASRTADRPKFLSIRRASSATRF